MDEFIVKLSDIFEQKKWDDSSGNRSLGKLISLGNYLDNEEREMLLTLMKNFTIINCAEYENYLIQAISFIEDDLIKKINHYYIMPLISPADRTKTKSSNLVAYLFNNQDLIEDSKLKGKKIFISNLESLPKKLNNSQSKLLILVDDFIGTGETAIECIDDLVKNGINQSKIVIISISAMRYGIDKILQKGVSLYTSKILDKGISKLKNLEMRDNYLKLMTIIEKRYGIPEELYFGYGKSEGLIKLIRPPNNTFPIFWHEKIPEIAFPRF